MPKSSSPAMVVVVGTSHTIQASDLKLKPFLESLCQKFKVRAIAEEMSEEALAEKNCAASIPMQVANALRVPHLFCDPSRVERAKLEIRQENDIRVEAFLSNSALSESEIAAFVTESHTKRERYWLDKLCNLSVWPILFICGADHVPSFCRLLKQQGIVTYIAAEDWASGDTVAN